MTDRRILILGPPGSGKTYRAALLETDLGIPAFDLDDLYWEAGWERPSPETFRSRLDAILQRNEWILSGMYAKDLRPRLERATHVLLLRPAPFTCVLRVVTRSVEIMFGRTSKLPCALRGRRFVRPVKNWARLLFRALRPGLELDATEALLREFGFVRQTTGDPSNVSAWYRQVGSC